MSVFAQLAVGWGFCSLVMLVAWLRQRRTNNANLVDVAWTANLGLLAVFYAATGAAPWPRALLLVAVVGAWSARLTGHLVRTRIVGEAEEDGRYRDLRGRWSQTTFFAFFQAQALLDVVLSVPFLLVARNAAPTLHPLEIVGVAVWIVGVVGESIADRQLDRFRSRPENRGRTCRDGLWRYSRHPNYFFEWVIWCGFAIVALAAPWGWIGLFAPALLLVSILKVTGIPPTEARALAMRGDDYRAYQRTTSAFIPWFPRTARPAVAEVQ